jgi:hypothetical protein
MSKRSSTYHSFAEAELALPRGRYDLAEDRPHLAGSEPLVRYPQASAPFQHDPVPPENSLGYRIDALEPLELAASPAQGNSGDAVASAPLDEAASPLSLSDPAVVSFPSHPDTSRNVDAGSPPLRRRRL